MSRKVARQIQPAVCRPPGDDSDSASTSDDGRTTERITARTVVRMKRRIPPKPAPRPVRVKKAAVAVKRAKAPVEQPPNAVPFQQIVVGEREGEPNYRKPGEPSNQGEDRKPGNGTSSEHSSALASGSQQAGPSADTAHGDAVEEPPFVPEPLPEGAHRPSVARLYEVLLGIDEIGQYDGHIRSEIADIGNLIASLRQREDEVAQKMRDSYRTRTALEKMYTSRVRLEPWLIGQGKRAREGEEQPEVAEEQLRRQRIANGKRRAEELTDAPSEADDARRRVKRGRSH